MGQPPLVRAVEHVLLEGRILLRMIDTEAYQWKDPQGCGASIGMHYRHVLEHFQCLLEGMESGRVDYDERRRSSELESSVDEAILATDNLMEEFRTLTADALQRECWVRYSVAGGNDQPEEARSTFGREVMFCVGHATHHYALMKPLCAQLRVDLPLEFGVAPSTLKHLQAQEVR
jgi:hypothetical protein